MTLQTSNRKEIQLTKCLPEIEVTLEAGLGSSPPQLTPLYQIEETETETGTETGAAEEGGPASKSLLKSSDILSLKLCKSQRQKVIKIQTAPNLVIEIIWSNATFNKVNRAANCQFCRMSFAVEYFCHSKGVACLGGF